MGWAIANLDNTVKLSEDCIKDLEANEYFADYHHVDHGKLYFNDDDGEWMDYVSNDEVQAILLKHKVQGVITFGSLQGDNFGEFWGYLFDGLGGMKCLTGRLSWSEV